MGGSVGVKGPRRKICRISVSLAAFEHTPQLESVRCLVYCICVLVYLRARQIYWNIFFLIKRRTKVIILHERWAFRSQFMDTTRRFGDANKLVSAVFSLAWKLQPSIIFIDEVDSFLGSRKNSDQDVNTSMKTEFMTMWDGFQTNERARVMVLAATNRPYEVDEAILRRLPRSFEIGLPTWEQRVDILKVILKDEAMEPGFFGPGLEAPVFKIAAATERYSGSDLKELCKSAAYGPIRDLLAAETRERNERRRTRRHDKASGSNGGELDRGRDNVDASFDSHLDEYFLDADDDFRSPENAAEGMVGGHHDQRRHVQRCITFADFIAVLSKGSTSAEAAAAYRHAEAERLLERDRRGRRAFRGGGGGDGGGGGGVGGSGRGGGSGSAAQAAADMQMAMSAMSAEQLQQLMSAFTGGSDGLGGGGGDGDSGNGPVLEVTPELLTQMLQQYMIIQQQNGGN